MARVSSQVLQEELGPSFAGLAPDCIGEQAEAFVERLQQGQKPCKFFVVLYGAHSIYLEMGHRQAGTGVHEIPAAGRQAQCVLGSQTAMCN
eukprot:1155823-Pelagomonas_calceolata.AAC.2